MGEERKEACGRCGISSVVDATDDGDRDPFGDERIAVDEREARAAMQPQIAVRRLKRRLDEIATRVTYGR